MWRMRDMEKRSCKRRQGGWVVWCVRSCLCGRDTGILWTGLGHRRSSRWLVRLTAASLCRGQTCRLPGTLPCRAPPCRRRPTWNAAMMSSRRMIMNSSGISRIANACGAGQHPGMGMNR